MISYNLSQNSYADALGNLKARAYSCIRKEDLIAFHYWSWPRLYTTYPIPNIRCLGARSVLVNVTLPRTPEQGDKISLLGQFLTRCQGDWQQRMGFIYVPS